MTEPEWLVAGRVGRPHGLDGSFHLTQGRPERLSDEHPVRIGERETSLERLAGTADRPIVRLALAHNREELAPLRGQELLVPRAAIPPLEEDEWYATDLEGLRVSDGERPVGVVRTLLALPSCEVLEVERDGDGDLLVPLVSDAVRSVDLEAGSIDIDLAFLGEA
ncbi:MAG: 16S rRNA processing protein RimM [Solirubrobacterales bacterium]|nr:16S rRNA processing protein RimM [Solirubrobacterales bacterium]